MPPLRLIRIPLCNSGHIMFFDSIKFQMHINTQQLTAVKLKKRIHHKYTMIYKIGLQIRILNYKGVVDCFKIIFTTNS